MRPRPPFEISLYVGMSGMGKTHLALSHLADRRRVLIHDPNCEDQLADGAEVVQSKEHLLALVAMRGQIRICWRGYGDPSISDAFEFANRCAWAGENFTVLWDEADKLTRGRIAPGTWAYQVVNSGRHRGLRLLATSRRPQRLPIDLRDGATAVYAFRLQGQGAIDYLSPLYGEASDGFPQLQERQHVDWPDCLPSEEKSS